MLGTHSTKRFPCRTIQMNNAKIKDGTRSAQDTERYQATFAMVASILILKRLNAIWAGTSSHYSASRAYLCGQF